MKFSATIKNEKHDIQIKRDNELLFAEVSGRKYELEVSEPEPNIFLFKHENKIYEISVYPDENFEGIFNVKVNSNDFEIEITDPRKLSGRSAQLENVGEKAEIKTAMPGKVVSVLKEVGSEAKKGEGVIVVEAMKMQNEMKSPKDGKITEIRVNEGDTVMSGDILLIIE